MKIDTGIKINKNTIYSSAGNIFSRLLLMQDILSREKSFLIITESDSQRNVYSLIGQELGIKINILDNYNDLVELLQNNNGKYVFSKDIINIHIPKISEYEINVGDKITPKDLAKKLNELNIQFSQYNNPYTFSIAGDTLNYVNNTGQIVKISFWDDVIDEIFLTDKKLQKYTFGLVEKIEKLINREKISENFINMLQKSESLIILDSIDFYNEYDAVSGALKNYIIFLYNSSATSINLGIDDLVIGDINNFKEILESNKTIKYIVTKNTKIINNFLELNNINGIRVLETTSNKLKSFKCNLGFVICDDNISRIFVRRRVKRTLSENMDLLMQIKRGDYVVHIDHGVGIFEEITEKELGGITKEYLKIEYKDNDILFVPITEASRLSKYVGVESPKLTSLSSKEWEKKIKKASEDVEKIASELLEIYAKRKLQDGFQFESFRDEENKFFSSFEHEYTADQYTVIEDIYKDMESPLPMDRLLSGDVGFGKTEVAFAAIYKTIINSKQAVLITPLIVLAYEHFEKAKERFKNFPFNIEVLTRFEKASKVKNILEKLKAGQIDLVIGTHRLLSADVKFKSLGLLVIDEEHKFGVKDKERIKGYKGNIDILSMSATPIPRSLNMALNGLKDVSMITTPPVGKQSIETIIAPFSDDIILQGAKREFDRGGQVFFIHNRVETILALESYLENLLPGKKIIVAHGQLSGDTLENRILAFKKGDYDILLATTVIENGIDFPNVNTIFINDANNFGISQIHQLRGRVGRASKKAYSYLLFKKDTIKEDAAKRLKTIVDYSHLGAGFELAIKDLEIRGGGDILGIKQSGSTADVGVSMFLEMLEDKIEELRTNEIPNKEENTRRINTIIDLNIGAFIPDSFFVSEIDKLNFYRELESIRNIEDLDIIIEDFGELGDKTLPSVINLFNLIRLKIISSKYKIKLIKRVGINYQIDFEDDTILEDLKEFLKLDYELKFEYFSPKRLRSLVKNFTSDEKFVQYLLLIFESENRIRKIKKKF